MRTKFLAAAMLLMLSSPLMAGDLQDALRAYWNFDTLNDAGADGATFGTDYFEDQSGNGRHAVIQMEGSPGNFANTNPQTAAGILGSAFRTERGTSGGENPHLYTATPDTDNGLDFTSDDSITFSLWTRSDYNQAFQRGNYFGKEEQGAFDLTAPDSGYLFARTGASGATTMQFHASDGSGPDINTFPNDGADQWDNDEWALWTLSYDGAGTLRFYVNGNLEDTETLPTGVDWSNAADFTIAHRNGGHQRSFAWPFGAGGEGAIDDFGVIAEDVTSAEAGAIYSLATNAELEYDLGKVLQLLDLHRDGMGNVEIDGLNWVFSDDPADFPGGLGQVVGSGEDFSLLLGSGTGVMTQAVEIPEPASIAMWTLLGLIGFAWQRRRRNK